MARAMTRAPLMHAKQARGLALYNSGPNLDYDAAMKRIAECIEVASKQGNLHTVVVIDVRDPAHLSEVTTCIGATLERHGYEAVPVVQSDRSFRLRVTW